MCFGTGTRVKLVGKHLGLENVPRPDVTLGPMKSDPHSGTGAKGVLNIIKKLTDLFVVLTLYLFVFIVSFYVRICNDL